jgi:hypothetical protein
MQASPQIADQQIATARVFDPAGRRHRARDVHDGGYRVEAGCRSDARHVVHPILKAHNGRIRTRVTCELSSGFLGVQALHAEEHDIGVPTCSHLRRSRNTNPLLEVDAVDQEAITPSAFTCAARPINVTCTPARASIPPK